MNCVFFCKNISQKLKWILMFVCFFFYALTLTSQISRTRTGWSGSLIQKMKSLRSFPCEEHMNNDLLFSTVGERFGLFSVSQGKPEGMNINWRPLEPVQLQWCSQCVTQRSSQQPLNALCIQHWDCLVEAVAGAQDKFCMHIFTYMCFHLSLNILNVYSEVIWCLSLTP